MSYIGSPPSTQSFAPGTDTFSGDGTTVAFTLSRNVATVNDILVVVNNVDQQPTAYTVSVSTLTFTAAPSSGTNNIYVRYLSTNLQSIVPQYGSVVPSSLSTPNALYWDTSGNVGVGTTNPAPYGKLAVAGSMTTVPDTSSILGVGRYTSGYGGAAISTNGGATFLAGQVEGVDQFRGTSTGLFQFNSGYGSVATAYGCRAWVNFNGTGTVAIRASGNVTSITDLGVGQYAVNITTAMPDASYSVCLSTSDAGGGGASSMYAYVADSAVPRTASAFRITSLISNGATFFDSQYLNAAVFR